MADLLRLFISVYNDEREYFSFTTQSSFKTALRSIRRTYCKSSLDEGICEANYKLYEHRWAYIMRFGIFHLKLVNKCLKICREQCMQRDRYEQTDRYAEREMYFSSTWFSSLIRNKTLNICSLGGGPGVDSLGFLEFLFTSMGMLNMDDLEIKVTTVDRDVGWKKTNPTLIRRVLYEYLEYQGTLLTNFIIADLTKPLSSNVVNQLKSADVILIVKVVSALRHNQVSCENLLNEIFRNMKHGAIFIYIDNNFKPDFDLVHKIVSKQKMGTLCELFPFNCRAFSERSFKNIRKMCKETFGISPMKELLSSALICEKYISFFDEYQSNVTHVEINHESITGSEFATYPTTKFQSSDEMICDYCNSTYIESSSITESQETSDEIICDYCNSIYIESSSTTESQETSDERICDDYDSIYTESSLTLESEESSDEIIFDRYEPIYTENSSSGFNESKSFEDHIKNIFNSEYFYPTLVALIGVGTLVTFIVMSK